jgi:AcrR family transcriptional regulator
MEQRMEQGTAGGVRARVRAEMIGEIKAAARRHLATDGANLSLRAIARDLGMVSSALYRYFASRDDLLTALILDAYNDLGEVAESADAAVADRADVRARWMAVARALRRWALANPAEYALLYGTPVPGYAAPQDTTGPASRPVIVLAAIMAEAREVDGSDIPLGTALRAEIRRIADAGAPGVSDPAMVRGLIAWTLLFGALNFELFGRINNLIDERDEWFDVQMRAALDYVGLS